MIATCDALGVGACLLRILREEEVCVDTLSLHYRFCQFSFAAPQYYAEVTLGTQRRAAYLGEDRDRALRLYALLLRGGVTPCTLCDILRDMRLSAEIF